MRPGVRKSGPEPIR